jgi:hypothetical protein
MARLPGIGASNPGQGIERAGLGLIEEAAQAG